MSIQYKIIPERKLLVEVIKDDVTLPELIELFIALKNDKDFVLIERVFSNIVNANFLLSPDEIINFVGFIKATEKNFSFRWALLAKNPVQTALAMLIENDPYFKDVVQVSSTMRGCLSFLKVEINDSDFEEKNLILLPRNRAEL